MIENSRQTLFDVGFLLFLGFCFCVVGIGMGSLASWDEAYYAVVSQAIIRSGDWIHFQFFNTPFYDKPPLYFWLTAFFYKVGGVSEFTTRLPSALAGIGTVLVTYFLGKLLFNRLVGLAGASVLLSSTDYLHYARWGTLDVTHLFFFTLAIYCFLKAKTKTHYWLWFWAASAGAVMTKGPLIVLAWGVLGLHTLLIRDFMFLKKREFWLGFLLALALVLPWHLAAYFHNPEMFVRDFLYKHYISRTGGAVEGHTGNYYYYIRTLINKYHPWVVLTAFSLPWVFWQLLRSREKRAYGLLILWIGVVLGFFTFLVQTKLQWYILPLHPALSLTVGLVLVQWLRGRSEWWLKSTVIIVLLLHIPFSSVLVQDYVPGMKALVPAVRTQVSESETVYLYEYHEQPAALFYYERSAAYIDSIEELDQYLARQHPLGILLELEKYERMKPQWDQRGFRAVEATQGLKRDMVLLSNKRALS